MNYLVLCVLIGFSLAAEDKGFAVPLHYISPKLNTSIPEYPRIGEHIIFIDIGNTPNVPAFLDTDLFVSHY